MDAWHPALVTVRVRIWRAPTDPATERKVRTSRRARALTIWSELRGRTDQVRLRSSASRTLTRGRASRRQRNKAPPQHPRAISPKAPFPPPFKTADRAQFSAGLQPVYQKRPSGENFRSGRRRFRTPLLL